MKAGSPAMKARYTRDLGTWHRRVVTLLVVGILAGGEAVSTLCNVLCAEHSHTRAAAVTVSDVVQNAGHHHASNEHEAVSPPSVHAHAADHAPQGIILTETRPDLHALLNVASENCCGTLGSARPTMTTARADNSALTASQTIASIDAIVVDSSECERCGSTHAPPAGELSSTRTPLPLRI